jgi:hypothetical protein
MLGAEHPFTQKMDAVLEESSEKVRGILERQEMRAMKHKQAFSVKATVKSKKQL